MASAADYLNPTELNRLQQIASDLADILRVRKDLNREKQAIKARAVKRLEKSQMRLRREAEANDGRVVL